MSLLPTFAATKPTPGSPGPLLLVSVFIPALCTCPATGHPGPSTFVSPYPSSGACTAGGGEVCFPAARSCPQLGSPRACVGRTGRRPDEQRLRLSPRPHWVSRPPPQDLTVLCHLEQLLLVTHLDLSHNRLRSLPPALAALRCLEVKPPLLCHRPGFPFPLSPPQKPTHPTKRCPGPPSPHR